MPDRRPLLLLLVMPALAMVLVLFVYPLGYSLVSAFTDRDGQPSLANFVKTFELYGTDIAFTLVIVVVGTLSGLLDWRGIIVTFAWKETPFVALLVSGAMAALDRASVEAARNLGAGGMRILVEILLPQVRSVMTVGLILAFVTMLSVLSVP